MHFEENRNNRNWLLESQELLRAASSPGGIKASLDNLNNYSAVFTRDAVMAGIAGVLLKDDIIIEGFKSTLEYLKKTQGPQGQIASNYTIEEEEVKKVSFGTLSPKIDACTWYLIGVGMLLQEEVISKDDFQISVERTIALLDAWEYNNKNLIYIPKGGNWADEYVYEGYILYDQLLRVWSLSLLGSIYENKDWESKSIAIKKSIEKKYKTEGQAFFTASIYPGGAFNKFDLAAHTIAGLVLDKENDFFDQTLDWVFSEFLASNNFPPAFYPIIQEGDEAWNVLRNYHLFKFKNHPHHYHNGGIWWIWLGWLAITFSLWGKKKALEKLNNIAFNFLKNQKHFHFEEYLSADKLIPSGTQNLCYSATGIIFISLAEKGFNFSKLKL